MDSSRSAQRAVIKFPLAEGEHAAQIYRRMKELYGEQCLAGCTIFRWCQRYEAGRLNIKDLPRPGQTYDMTNSATISAVIIESPHKRSIEELKTLCETEIQKIPTEEVLQIISGKYRPPDEKVKSAVNKADELSAAKGKILALMKRNLQPADERPAAKKGKVQALILPSLCTIEEFYGLNHGFCSFIN
ncbi:hypothetical protein AVEN_171208-1 [Araneus ventricosus]|uniref:Mos1 transposase HTH domain-containing protein n=1 Tax=Araneus ventricosus TaxID=182803 RepID=A0A4Y2HGF7_ARAVE|nr:hypothetical protein AVEN_171208-1 [Araneus ventricosus]